VRGNARQEPLFLARETYRRRRIKDAARFLPFAAAVLFAVPVLWASTTGTVAGMVYLFGIWIILILAAGAIARALSYGFAGRQDDGPPGDDGAS
jgi:hypothetical protein